LTKLCTACGVTKPIDQYNKRAASKDGLNGWCRPCVNAKSLAWYRGNRERVKKNHREYMLRSQYGIGEAEFQRLLKLQGSKCALCPVTFSTEGSRRNLCVDHDHDTGQVRGLLCARCNTSIGQLGDSAEGLRRALAYVEGATSLEVATDEELVA
jgi:hypothetical protein